MQRGAHGGQGSDPARPGQGRQQNQVKRRVFDVQLPKAAIDDEDVGGESGGLGDAQHIARNRGEVERDCHGLAHEVASGEKAASLQSVTRRELALNDPQVELQENRPRRAYDGQIFHDGVQCSEALEVD